MNQPIRVYADTSVYGGVFDPEFAFHSRMFFDQVRQGRFLLVVSPVVRREIEDAPPQVRAQFVSVIGLSEEATISPEALDLRDAYLTAGILSERSSEDALHVALATLSPCHELVSWNFKHIVHREKGPRYNAVNILRGLPTIGIHSPAEVVKYEEGL